MKLFFKILIILLIPLGLSAQIFYPQESNINLLGSFGTTEFGGGGGISFVDFNQDGLDDLTFGTENNKDIMFYENKGDHFELVDPPFVEVLEESKQLVWVDFDKDNDKDFFVSTYNGQFYLFENDGNMSFTDVTVSKGLENGEADTYSANFADIDMDGWLDLYIGRYGEEIFGDTNSMFHYSPHLHKYINVTNQTGTGNGFRETLATSFFDFDLDGDLDLYVSNDRLMFENSLYMNMGNLSFVDVSVPSLSNASIDAMNAGVADFDDDGYLDIYITHTSEAIMYKNNGNNTFTDVASSSGTILNQYAWCGNYLDFDHDEDEDMYVCTTNTNQPNVLFVNQNNGTFIDPLTASGGIAGLDTLDSFTNAIGDFNNDGKQDIAVSRDLDESFSLFSNNEETENNFIKLRLKGTFSNKEAYGALVEIWNNGYKRIYQKHSTVGFQSQNSDDMIMGLGASSNIDSIVVKWPYPNSINTYYGNQLLINGTNEFVENSSVVNFFSSPICLENHDVSVNPIPSHIYGASNFLESNSTVLSGTNILFQSENEITLGLEFEVEIGAEFEAEINLCGN